MRYFHHSLNQFNKSDKKLRGKKSLIFLRPRYSLMRISLYFVYFRHKFLTYYHQDTHQLENSISICQKQHNENSLRIKYLIPLIHGRSNWLIDDFDKLAIKRCDSAFREFSPFQSSTLGTSPHFETALTI